MDLSAAAQRGIGVLRETLVASPPPGVESGAVEEFFNRYEETLVASLGKVLRGLVGVNQGAKERGKLDYTPRAFPGAREAPDGPAPDVEDRLVAIGIAERSDGSSVEELGPSAGESEETRVPYFRRKIAVALAYEVAHGLGRKKEVRLTVRDRRDKSISYHFAVQPVEDGALVSSSQTSTRVHIAWKPNPGDIQRAMLRANSAAERGEIANVWIPGDLPQLPALAAPVASPQSGATALRPAAERPAEKPTGELLDYSLFVVGVFGRNRTPHDLTKRILSDVPRSSPKTLDELVPKVRELLELEKVRSDAKIVVKEWKTERTASGIERTLLGSARELFRGSAKDLLQR